MNERRRFVEVHGRVRRKHRGDHNHGRYGWVVGSPRYDRRNPTRGMLQGRGAKRAEPATVVEGW